MQAEQGEVREVFSFIDHWSCYEFSASKRVVLLEENAKHLFLKVCEISLTNFSVECTGL
jgi:hypothetical protein